MSDAPQVDAGRMLAIIQEEAPQVFQLAVRRAIIEQQAEQIAQLKQALGMPLDAPVLPPVDAPQ
jgi:hypothetical protein